ncbi:hypothetical protein Tco_1061756 [Tanacetum coccineum]
MHDPLKWWLYDTCGVHHVSTERGHDIYMLVEKDYLLTKALATLMLCNKLRVDQYFDMPDELLQKINIIANRPRQFARSSYHLRPFPYRRGIEDEGPGLEEEGHGSEDEGPGSEEEEEEVALEGQQQAVPVMDTTTDEPLGLGYRALRRRELSLGEVRIMQISQENGQKPDKTEHETEKSARDRKECTKAGDLIARRVKSQLQAPRNQDNKNKESSRRSVPVETSTSTALVSCDGLGGYD